MSRTMIGLVVAAAAAVLPGSGRAVVPSPCTAMDEIRRALDEGFAERPVARGLQQDGSLINVFASDGGETFTVVVASPTGVGCIVADGTNWEGLAPGDASAEAWTSYRAARPVVPSGDFGAGRIVPR